jgi:hypothetical protein
MVEKAGINHQVSLPCRAAYCPVCADRKARTLFRGMRRRVLETVGDEGAAIHLMLTLPQVSGHLLDEIKHLAREVRSARNAPRWRGYFASLIGVVMALEISHGKVRRGHPHVHFFVFGPEKNSVVEFLDWLTQRWAARNPGARTLTASMLAIGPSEREWAPRLFYVLKGSAPSPAWGPELLLEVVGALGAGQQLITCWGLAKGKWARTARALGCETAA